MEEIFSCPIEECGKTYKTKALMNKHMKECGKVFKCMNDTCGKQYKHRGDLTKHQKSCGMVFICEKPDCQLELKSEKSFQQHVKVCGNQRCAACGQDFKTELSIQRHQANCRVRTFFELLLHTPLIILFFFLS